MKLYFHFSDDIFFVIGIIGLSQNIDQKWLEITYFFQFVVGKEQLFMSAALVKKQKTWLI
jgi:hypothetical protein